MLRVADSEGAATQQLLLRWQLRSGHEPSIVGPLARSHVGINLAADKEGRLAMKVLVAGAHGKTARRLVRMLAQDGHEVRGLVRKDEQIHPPLRWATGQRRG